MNLADKPSGCVVWILFDARTLELGPYLWFGGAPRERLPELGLRRGHHSRADSSGVKRQRPNIRIVARRKFVPLAAISDVADMRNDAEALDAAENANGFFEIQVWKSDVRLARVIH